MLEELFDLGALYVSDFLKPDEEPAMEPQSLKLVRDDKTCEVRLQRTVDPTKMYGRYWYRSGTNATMTAELASIVESIRKLKPVPTDDATRVWMDIACNDGTLLKFVPGSEYLTVGIDPCDDTFADQAREHADTIVQDFFTQKAWQDNTAWIADDAKADVVTCIAMFYDLDDPAPFLNDVHAVMADDGVFVLQMSYSPLMLAQTAFDNICHEHVYYYTLYTLAARLEAAGFRVMDCQLNDVNGGSFRVYAVKQTADVTTFGTQPQRDVANFRVISVMCLEDALNANDAKPWLDFWETVKLLKEETVNFIKAAKADGKTVWGYGASTKGNTLLQLFGLDHTLIDGIAERSPYKFGLKTVGTNIPIYSEEEMRAAKPDYLLVLPWHFIGEFVQREAAFLEAGGKFIVPCPVFSVISSA